MMKAGYKQALLLFAWVASVLVGAYVNSRAVPQAVERAFLISIGLSIIIAFFAFGVIWLLARQGRRPKNLGLFYLLFIALNVVFFGDRGTVSSVVFAVEFFRSLVQ